jgi:hypothetical protein
MNHPVITSANGNERYKKMLNEAENYRRVRTITASQLKKTTFGKFRTKIISQLPQLVGKSADSPA